MPSPSVSVLRRFDAFGWELWLVPLLGAAAGVGLLGTAGDDLALLRGLVFVGGPLLLLAGLHARLEGYLHSSARLSLLPRPLPPRSHWAAARGPHLRGLAITGGLGALTVGAAGLGAGLRPVLVAGVVGDFGWLWLAAVLVEPVIPAAGAWLGRRFDEDRPEHRWQRWAGGGWTIPEAVVHLYAPALGVGLSALVAMPGQLWIDRSLDGASTPPALLGAAVGAMVVAALGGWLAARAYARGMFGAVPWVHEAVRTLAGPPVPEPVPRWMLLGRDPVQHLVIRQFWRTTPVPGLRLLAMLGGAVWIGLAATPSVAATAVLLALAAVWIVPGTRVRSLGPARARLCASLPVPAAARAGRSAGAWAVLLAPVLGAAVLVAAAWSGRA